MQAQQQKPILYSYFRSSTSWRVRIALNLKQIPYDMKFIHLVKGEQSSEEYKKINPNGAVPALIVSGNEILIESFAICEYLEEAYPESKAMLPKDPIKRAQIRGFCEFINSGVHPYQNLRLLKKVHEAFQADKIEWAKEWVTKGMKVIEELLGKSKGKYCFGDEITLADAFFVPQVQGAVARFSINIDDFPNCKEVLKNLQKVDAFQQAEPKNQPDFE